ncbi:uncharacterized protein LOC113874394 [Abrus precatorius]|uniref:Uncharacterized protein LOC113874394 n=1 Tax=Abrus precatorius TaxID=3816 RepID=A0A8B8MLD4_ABRPR|nr:uncharacterized protein LOC113874394 [Abrus precatorius]
MASLMHSISDKSQGGFISDDEDLPKNKWYKQDEDMRGEEEFDPCLEIEVLQEESKEWCKPWRGSLIVKVFGKRIHPRILENKLKRDWVRAGSIKIIDLPRDYYIVSFTDENDYKHAPYEGPWKVADHYLIVQRWRLFFLKTEQKVRKIAVWVRIPGLNMELYNTNFLRRVGSKIGTMLKVDQITSIHSRGRFARICVELDIRKKLVPQVKVWGVAMNLEYEGLHQVCFNCGRYGHKQEWCSEKNLDPQVDPTVVQPEEGAMEMSSVGNNLGNTTQIKEKDVMINNNELITLSSAIENGKNLPKEKENSFSPWMLVKRAVRKKERITTQGRGVNYTGGNKGNQAKGSRFNALHQEESEMDVEEIMVETVTDMHEGHVVHV